MTLYHMYDSHQDWLETNRGSVALVYWQLSKVVELHVQYDSTTLRSFTPVPINFKE